MLEFKEITLSDKGLVDSYFKKCGFMGCEYAFSNLFIWRKNYKTSIAEYMGFLLVKYEIDGQCYFLMPAGEGDLKALLLTLIEQTKMQNCKFILAGVTTESIVKIDALLPNTFKFKPSRDSFDYIYLSEELINLTGKKNQSKRNHINKFEAANGTSCYENITPENLPECMETYCKWAAEHEGADHSDEYKALTEALNNFNTLQLMGGLIRVNGKVCAFTAGAELNKDVFVVHIEKGLEDFPGVYPTINREFVKNCCNTYKYINREEDLGIEGLRKSKLSYHPEILLEKHLGTLI